MDNGFTFEEFMIFCYNYLPLNFQEMASFAFHIFDFNGNGKLDRTEVITLIRVIWGKDKYTNNAHLQRTMDKLTGDIDDAVTLTDFLTFARQYPVIIQPAFLIQDNLRIRICGKQFWDKMHKQRTEDHGSASMFDILQRENTSYRAIERLAAIEELPPSIINDINAAKMRSRVAVKAASAHSVSERQKHMEEMRKRKQQQTTDANMGIVRRLTVTATDVLGNKFQRAIARPHLASQSGDESPPKPKPVKEGFARRVTKILFSKQPNSPSTASSSASPKSSPSGLSAAEQAALDREEAEAAQEDARERQQKAAKKKAAAASSSSSSSSNGGGGILRRISHAITGKKAAGAAGSSAASGGGSGRAPAPELMAAAAAAAAKKKESGGAGGIVRRISQAITKPLSGGGNARRRNYESPEGGGDCGDGVSAASSRGNGSSSSSSQKRNMVQRISIMAGFGKAQKPVMPFSRIDE